MKKPFLLIAGDNYYPSAGIDDWVECFAKKEEAMSWIEENNKIHGKQFDWYEIIDLNKWVN